MLSEEHIKCIENNIKQSKRLFEEVGVYAYFDKENMTTVEKLIQGYKELKEENKRLTSARNWYFEHYTARACTPEMLDKILRFDYIPKSLVEEKIEELNKKIDEAIDNSKGGLDEDFINKGTELIAQKRVLEELLKGDE